MGKQEEALRVAQALLEDIELGRLEAPEIVLKANQLARLVGHTDLLTFLGLERNGYTGDASQVRWIDKSGRHAPEGKYYSVSIAKVQANAHSAEEALKTLAGGGNFSGEYALLSSREHLARVASYTSAIGTWNGITGQVTATVYDMVVEIYHELLFSELQETLFSAAQSAVDGALAVASGSALDKIERVSDRLRDGDPESVSQALTTCRRLIDSCADYLFPSSEVDYDLGDGATLKVGKPHVLNRIQAYCHSQGISKSRRDRLRRTLIDLYDRCSAATHAEVVVHEARFVFLQTYVALGEILTLASDGIGGQAHPE